MIKKTRMTYIIFLTTPCTLNEIRSKRQNPKKSNKKDIQKLRILRHVQNHYA